MLWALDDRRDDGMLVVEHANPHRPEPQEWDEPGTYVSTDQVFTNTRQVEWSHGLGEIVQSLLDAGLVLTALEEHESVPWAALPGMVSREDGEWRLPERAERLPLTYTLQARKPGPRNADAS